MARSNNDSHAEVPFQQGTCKIILKRGDLLAENNIDVKVIPTPESGQCDGQTYPLYEKFLANTEPLIESNIRKLSGKIKSAGNPQIIDSVRPYIILTPTPYYRNQKAAFKLLQQTYTKCLQLATKNKCQSIAFPTIGCGASGFNSIDAADILYNALAEYEKSNPKTVNEIRIIIFKDDIYNEFVNLFYDIVNSKKTNLKSLDISTNDTKPAEIVPRKDDKLTSQKQTQDSRDPDYGSDFESELPEKQRRDIAQRSSNLNPDSHEFRPQDKKNQIRPQRRYLLNNKSTELVILQGDILQTKVDAIVNAANEGMLGGGGVDEVIHRAAGDELLKACKVHKKIYRDVRLPTGRSRILLSYKMSKTTHYIINTAGPRYDDYGPEQCKEQLTSCYKTSLALANLYDLETIGYTAISCGIFGYPLDEGAEVALQTVDRKAGLMREITFVLREDEIYDAWVKKAKELSFTSLDHVDTDTSAPNQPNKKSKSIVQTSDDNDDNKKPEKLKRDQGVTSAEDRNERNVVDASTSNKPKKGSTAANDRSPEQSRSDAVKQSNNKESTNDKENDEQNSDAIKAAVSRVAGRVVGDLHKQGFQSNSSPTQQNRQNEKGSSTNPTLKLHSGGAWGRGKPTNKDPKT